MDRSHRLIIVRRDRPAILCAILRYPDRWPTGTAVMLDRRGERWRRDQPVPIDRRRRSDSPWSMQGFTVVHVDHLPTEAIPLDAVSAMPEVLTPA